MTSENNEIIYNFLDKTTYYDFEGNKKKQLEVEFKTDKTTFRNCSEEEIIDYLFKKLHELERKINLQEQKEVGFITLPKSLQEVWNNPKEDEWDKFA